MLKETALSLRHGDLVIAGTWEDTETVDHVNSQDFPDDPVIFFVNGGFWRSSRVSLVGKVSGA